MRVRRVREAQVPVARERRRRVVVRIRIGRRCIARPMVDPIAVRVGRRRVRVQLRVQAQPVRVELVRELRRAIRIGRHCIGRRGVVRTIVRVRTAHRERIRGRRVRGPAVVRVPARVRRRTIRIGRRCTGRRGVIRTAGRAARGRVRAACQRMIPIGLIFRSSLPRIRMLRMLRTMGIPGRRRRVTGRVRVDRVRVALRFRVVARRTIRIGRR